MVALVVALVIVVMLLGYLVAGLLRSNAELTRAVHHLGVDLGPVDPAGQPVMLRSGRARPTPARPDVTDLMDLAGATPAGGAVSLAVSGVRHDTLVAFLTSGCATCRDFWDAFRSGPPEVPGGARLVVVTRGPEAEAPGAVEALAGPTLPVVMSTTVWDHYDIPYAPYFVYVSGAGRRIVGEGVAGSWNDVRALVATAVADGTTRRDTRIDRDLAAVGIQPGDPRLHPTKLSSPDHPAHR